MIETDTNVAPKCPQCKPLPDRALLKKFLSYNPSTGHFTWLHTTVKGLQGKRAGTLHNKGYRTVNFHGTLYLEHRLAWLMHHGEEPPPQIDHENRDKSDNRIKNLRAATGAQNGWNSGPQKNNRSGQRHICWEKLKGKSGRWKVIFATHEDGKMVVRHRSRHARLEDAIKARDAAAARLHGEFAFRPSPA